LAYSKQEDHLMNTITIRTRRVGTALLLVALSACGESSIFGPDNQLQVSNNADQFSLQAQTVVDQSGTESYDWVVTTNTAAISHANAALTGGTATVTILDADGTQVYTASLSEASNGNSVSDVGVIGTWTVIITMTNATTDHINFQIVPAN